MNNDSAATNHLLLTIEHFPPMLDTALLLAAAFVAGALNAVAGGGSFLTLPASVFTGVPPVVANATGTVALLPGYKAIAQEAGCTPAQLALAWLLHQGPDLIPIPGTTSEAHLRENMGALDVRLDAALLARLDAHINQRTVAGNRYGAQARVEVDTEEFAN